MSRKRVLVVEDEPQIIEVLRLYLERAGFEISSALTAAEARERFRQGRPDLVILDLNLPDEDGLEVCRDIRRQASTPIIMLTARDEVADRVVGLELGADDYIVKPFSPREVVARVKAVLRRSRPAPSDETLSLGDLELNVTRYEVRCRGHPIELTPTEFRMLEAFVRHPGRVYTRGQLLDLAQGEAFEGYERTVDAHIKNLRRKLAAGGCNVVIETVRGVGYRLKEAGA